MLYLKSSGLVVLSVVVVVAYFVSKILNNLIKVELIYPYSLNFMVDYLYDRGMGYLHDSNTMALGFNVIIRVSANIVIAIVELLIFAYVLPYSGLIWYGMLLGWYTSVFLSVYEECQTEIAPRIGCFECTKRDSKSGSIFGYFRKTDNDVFAVKLDDWELGDLLVENRCYVVMMTDIFEDIYLLQYEPD